MCELRPCPFCGGSASSRITRIGENIVICKSCLIRTIGSDTEEEAIASWNRRVTAELSAIPASYISRAENEERFAVTKGESS